MEAVFWIWQDYRKYRIRNSMFVTMFWGLINEMGQFNDFTRDAFSLVVNLRTDLPPMMTQNIRQLLFRKESWKCRTSEAIGDEFGFVFDNLLDGIYPSSPNLSISSPLLPELRTIYISGFEHGEPHSRVARYNQFRDANVANRYHTLDKSTRQQDF
ncbi:hypothetical protein M7I_3824 [Glarea lozoyensis 74030]|uniref:Uncharacterized protein n=1 Tax=Glarea lozoyensis (strain ATCC 74030 / MF5533) TaxID=1104152 RepID=H0EMI7_GLAL7|nr:hypothetical protein M7I_3824 [Glarea lozoyensis 74030]